MQFVILFPDSLAIFVLLDLIPSFAVVLRLRLMILVFLCILLVIFVLFVLANMMLRPDVFTVMKLSALLHMVLTCLTKRRRKMFEKAKRLFKGLLSHFSSGCSLCVGFAKHIAKIVVQILKGGDSY